MDIKEFIDKGLIRPQTDKAGNIIVYYMVGLDNDQFMDSIIEEVHKDIEFENTVAEYNA